MDELTSDILDPRDEIARLEDRIEQLDGKLEGCRKIMLASRIAIVLGAVLLAAGLFGLIAFDAATMLGAIATILGGFVLLGSNRTTANEAEEQRATAEARRAELIAALGLRVVSERPTLH
jgi:hypothetical protein